MLFMYFILFCAYKKCLSKSRLFNAFMFFMCVKYFRKKKKINKKFKTVLITFIYITKISIIIVFFYHYNISSLSQYFFIITIFLHYHNIFPSSQYFSIITIFLYYHNIYPLSQYLSIITIFIHYQNIFSIITIFLHDHNPF